MRKIVLKKGAFGEVYIYGESLDSAFVDHFPQARDPHTGKTLWEVLKEDINSGRDKNGYAAYVDVLREAGYDVDAP